MFLSSGSSCFFQLFPVGSPWYTVTTVYFTRCRLGDPGRKIASSCEEFEYSEGVYCVNDTYLIVPSVNSHLLLGEIQHICDWVESNNLKLSIKIN